ncbi:16S rRNA (guanine(966)-N(2))-methyltransferase RsmD [Syntrophaceticus schinkii]|uniref:Methyltransferase n=1 Tax=Syntrophaceticus schinkii TaxID=499207 RepID=A0A0B7MPL3_9FIRM|nr:16S rRNA (guanine(966)-N(2))-methyltransferase RsmD [Syntrophaceticus schinkii]CEO89662.1 Methyltransferase [Syntrophaceticus schinkii]
MITGEKMSRLRVIGGIAKGKRLKTRNVKHLRPATDFVKEALFNILTNQVPGSLFLDLFAGSGSIGIEALSRGALKACFVERDPLNAELIRENLAITGFTEQAEVYICDIIRGLYLLSQKEYRFDLIFVDPPFRKGLIEPTLDLIWELDLLVPGGLIITRSAKKEEIKVQKNPLRQEKYGDSILMFFC